MQQTVIIRSLEEIDAAARAFLGKVGGRSVIAFYAPMGAGKTTFVSALCQALGVPAGEVSSPTFAIVNEYVTASGESIFHFDFYRIKSLAEALDTGLYDYLDSGCLCLLEWPENIEELLPEETLKVYIEVAPDGVRTLRWED